MKRKGKKKMLKKINVFLLAVSICASNLMAGAAVAAIGQEPRQRASNKTAGGNVAKDDDDLKREYLRSEAFNIWAEYISIKKELDALPYIPYEPGSNPDSTEREEAIQAEREELEKRLKELQKKLVYKGWTDPGPEHSRSTATSAKGESLAAWFKDLKPEYHRLPYFPPSSNEEGTTVAESGPGNGKTSDPNKAAVTYDASGAKDNAPMYDKDVIGKEIAKESLRSKAMSDARSRIDARAETVAMGCAARWLVKKGVEKAIDSRLPKMATDEQEQEHLRAEKERLRREQNSGNNNNTASGSNNSTPKEPKKPDQKEPKGPKKPDDNNGRPAPDAGPESPVVRDARGSFTEKVMIVSRVR